MSLFFHLGFHQIAMALKEFKINKQQIEQNDDFGIFGPDELCLYYGSIIGEFSGGGLPTDVFSWRILREDGGLVISREGGFQTFGFTFSEEGNYIIELNIRRGTAPVFSGSKKITINNGSDLIIQNSYLICEDGFVDITLINPDDPKISEYVIEWKNLEGQSLGSGNVFRVDQPGVYRVDFFTRNEQNQIICPFTQFTSVSLPQEYTVSISDSELCFVWNEVFLSTDIPIPGSWYYEKIGTPGRVLLGEMNNLVFNVLFDLNGVGNYELIFIPDNSNNTFCKVEDRVFLNILPQPEVNIEVLNFSDNCSDGNGEVKIDVLSELDAIFVYKVDDLIFSSNSISLSDSPIVLSDLESGVYSARVTLGTCTRFYPFVIGLVQEPEELKFQIFEMEDEICTETGIKEGKIKFRMLNGPIDGKFRVLSINGLAFTEDELPGSTGSLKDQEEFEVNLRAGMYYLEVIDANGCVLSTPESFLIGAKDQVSFDVPVRLNICGEFELFPNTDQDLIFELVYPDNQIVTRLTGEPFILIEGGDYTIRGYETDPDRGFCPRELTFRVIANESVNYEPVLVSQDCFGNKTYRAEVFGRDPSNLIITWYNELDQIVGNGQFLFPTSLGEFKLDVQIRNAETCPNPPKRFLVNRAVLQVDVDIIEAQYCDERRFSIITVDTDFDEAEYFEWIFVDLSGNTSNLTQFNGLSEIEIEQYGFYEVVVYNGIGCEIGRKIEEFRELIDVADFSIPEELLVCENYNLFPEFTLDLEFIVTSPGGNQFTVSKGDPIFVDSEGVYVVQSKSSNTEEPLCRMIKEFNVKIVQPIDFEVVLFSEDCDGNLVYKAEIFNEDPELFDFYWYETNGNIISTDQFFQTTAYGEFQLDVRPKNSLICPRPFKSFVVEEPILSVDIILEALPICPDPGFTFIKLLGDLGLFIPSIKWYHTDAQGNRVAMDKLENVTIIAVEEEGLYEVEVYNSNGCLLGSEEVFISKSQDQVRPEVEPEYTICPALSQALEINPGQFSQYEWYLDGVLYHDGSTLIPSKPGEYILVVTSGEGCRFTTSFVIKEDCVPQVVYPNAIVQGDPERSFVVYSNSLVDELSVWIYNKWGQLLFYCLDANVVENKASCEWAGKFEGDNIPSGSYVVKIEYKNKVDNTFKSEIKSLLVFDKVD